MSQPRRGAPPFRVVYSGRFRESLRQLLERAAALGRFAELAQVMRDIHTRLEWIPLDFGDPFRDLHSLGLVEHIGVLPPVVLTYAVDEVRRIVYVSVPFKLLPNSGL